MPLSREPETITYRNIPEGCGGTFDLASPIGTRDCDTCVGLFIQIDANRCYVAHINATIQVQDSWDSLRRVQDDEGARLERMILSKLQHAAREGGWTAEEVAPSNITIICPRPEAPLTGHHVINAIEAFFGGRFGHGIVQKGYHGFVIDRAGGKEYLLPSEGFDGDPFEKQWVQVVDGGACRFVAEDEGSARDDWAPEVTRRSVGTDGGYGYYISR